MSIRAYEDILNDVYEKYASKEEVKDLIFKSEEIKKLMEGEKFEKINNTMIDLIIEEYKITNFKLYNDMFKENIIDRDSLSNFFANNDKLVEKIEYATEKEAYEILKPYAEEIINYRAKFLENGYEKLKEKYPLAFNLENLNAKWFSLSYTASVEFFHKTIGIALDNLSGYDDFCDYVDTEFKSRKIKNIEASELFSPSKFQKFRILRFINSNENILNGEGQINLNEIDVEVEMRENSNLDKSLMNITFFYKGEIIDCKEDEGSYLYDKEIFLYVADFVNKIYEKEQITHSIYVGNQQVDYNMLAIESEEKEDAWFYEAGKRQDDYALFSNQSAYIIKDKDSCRFDGRVYPFDCFSDDDEAILQKYDIDEEGLNNLKERVWQDGLDFFWENIDDERGYLDERLKEAGLFDKLTVIERKGKDFYIAQVVDFEQTDDTYTFVNLYKPQPKDEELIIKTLTEIRENLIDNIRSDFEFRLSEDYELRQEQEEEEKQESNNLRRQR